ncbi:MAG: cytochrome c1 [Candidatus Hodgkinia cicadicola]
MTATVVRIRRGFEVFRHVCINCHPLAAFKLTDLKQLGFTFKQALLLVSRRKLSGYFVLPFPSEAKARSLNGGIVPPDLSFELKQKTPQQVYKMLTGYSRGLVRSPDNLYYNRGFELGVTSMRPPLSKGCFKSCFKAPATTHQYSHDVIGFLDWVSEPWRPFRMRLTLPLLTVFLMSCVLTEMWANWETKS